MSVDLRRFVTTASWCAAGLCVALAVPATALAEPVPSPVPPMPAPAQREEPGFLDQMMANPAFKSAMRSAGTVIGREITRSIFGTGRRRRRR